MQAPARRKRDTPTPRVMESAHRSVQSLSPPLGWVGSLVHRPFEMVRWELPKLDCAEEAHFKRGDVSLLF
jgi:hypothetical protein